MPIDSQFLQAIRHMLPKFISTMKEEQFYFANGSLDVTVRATRHHKGQAGKVLVVGGCSSMHGAPAFASLGALHMGMELARVITDRSASDAIKAHSPQLVVSPCLPSSESSLNGGVQVNKVGDEVYTEFLTAYSHLGRHVADPSFYDGHAPQGTSLVQTQRQIIEHDQSGCLKIVGGGTNYYNVCILGPGLGRDIITLSAAAIIAKRIIEQGIALILDAEGLLLVPLLLRWIGKLPESVILTPNSNELQRLRAALPSAATPARQENKGWKLEDCVLVTRGQPECVGSSGVRVKAAYELAEHIGCTVYAKGPFDFFTNGNISLVCAVEGSSKRSGGQGDVLTGVLAANIIFAKDTLKAQETMKILKQIDSHIPEISPILLAALTTSVVCRISSNMACKDNELAMSATDMINHINDAYNYIKQSSLSGNISQI